MPQVMFAEHNDVVETFPSDRADQAPQRWSRFLRQPVKVDLTMRRMIHHEDPQTVHG